jgi:GNAT superfamily N-acetyltransferase
VSNRWMPSLELKVTPEQFGQLPRSAAYDYTYHAGSAWLSPRPRYYHARLDLRDLRLERAARAALRPLADGDWPELEAVFADAFAEEVPFAALTAEGLKEAASVNLGRTREGGDGPLIAPASFVAMDARGAIVGAALVTLVPLNDLTRWDSCIWDEAPPPGAVERRQGRPHLTWVFVRPDRAGRGVGTALLAASAAALAALGFEELVSTFMAGNESSLLWHWRAGFRLLSYPGSLRLLMEEG